MRLIDNIRTGGAQMPMWVAEGKEDAWVEYAQQVLPLLADRELTVILADNVAEYYYVGSDQEFWSFERDFPNLAPPYERFWVESKLPRAIHSKEEGDTDMSHILGREGRVGVLFTALDPKDVKADVPDEVPKETRWILWMDLFIDYHLSHGDRPHGPHGAIFACIDQEGRMLGTPWIQSYARAEDAGFMKSLMTWLHPALLTISFLHCKNVRVDDQQVPKPLAKKYHAKHSQWPTKYKTLVIEPLKQILRREGNSDKNGLQKAMHICRGHFRDYREGRGLFGKYHQIVWTPSVVRGTKGKKAAPREVEVKI